MKKYSLSSIVLSAMLPALFLVGCGGGETQVKELAGRYHGRAESRGNPNDPTVKQAMVAVEAMAELTRLELTADNKFMMVILNTPVEGDVERSGTSLKLTPTKISGQPVAEYIKDDPTGEGKGLGSPNIANVNSKGEIEINPPEGQQFKIIFVRIAEYPVGPSTVKPNEASIVGHYHTVHLEKFSSGNKFADRGGRVIASHFTMDFRNDNTYVQDMGVVSSGTWSLQGDKIHIKNLPEQGGPAQEADLPINKDGTITWGVGARALDFQKG